MKNKIKESFTNRLFREFPNLFKHRKDKMKSLMCFGVDCAKGWHPLVYNLTRQINEYVIIINKEYKETHRINEYISPTDTKPTKLRPEIVQIKEKFGMLRYYMEGSDKYIYDLINRAEEESGKICECCGKPGSLRTDGWFLTLCNSCHKKRNTDKNWSVYD